jgi:hypothetical protein
MNLLCRYGQMQHPKSSSLWVQGLELFWHYQVITSSTITATGNYNIIQVFAA